MLGGGGVAGGQLFTCGKDTLSSGVLGQGESVRESAFPRVIAELGGVRIRTVAAGDHHTLACSDEGVAYPFGFGEKGQLSHATASQHSLPEIEALQGVHISMVAAGCYHSLALRLYSFGGGHDSALGRGDR